MLWDWKTGEVFRFCIRKSPFKIRDATDCQYFVVDRLSGKWQLSATITSPNGGKKTVGTIGPALASFLENFGGVDKAFPKIATYCLWTGPDDQHISRLTHASGDGKWGRLGNSFFLAEGDDQALTTAFARIPTEVGSPQFGDSKSNFKLDDAPVPRAVLPLPR